MLKDLTKKTAIAAFALLAPALLPFSAAAQSSAQSTTGGDSFAPDKQQEIRDIVRDYLLENPEVLVEALGVYQERQRIAAEERQKQAVMELSSALAGDPGTPVLGNPEGDVQIVEFFDYNCGYCKNVAQGVRDTIAGDKGIRLVMKEFPILGAPSRYAARAALAAAEQDLYEEFHFTLMTAPGRLSEARVMAVARQVGLDVDKLKADMENPEIDAALRRTFALAEGLEITGTPAFVIGDRVFPGALDLETIKHVIAEVRAGAS